MGSRFRPKPAAVLLIALAFSSQALHAGTVCDSADVIKYLPPLPRGCHLKRIEATGGLSFGILRSPEGRAEAAWQRQVVFLFGERYQEWKKAACKKVYCVHASIAGSRRCIYSAFPCSSDTDTKLLEALNAEQPTAPEPWRDEALTAPGIKQHRAEAQTAPEAKQRRDEALAAPEIDRHRDEALTAAEIKEMQDLLATAGYRVLADGVFGDRTKSALIRWQQRRGLPENGTASRDNLEKLRHMPDAAKGINPRSGGAQYRPRYKSELRWRRHFARHWRPVDRGTRRRRPKEPAWGRHDRGRFAVSQGEAFGFLSSLEARDCAPPGTKKP